jgi:hypothetical protein
MYFVDAVEQPNIAAALSIFIMLLFVAAFYFAYKNYNDSPSIFIISAALFVNFFIANNALYEFLTESKSDEYFYLRWVQYDAITVIGAIVGHYMCKVRHHKITSTIMYLLFINIGMYLALHVDIVENGNREPWWLWSLYTPVVNIVELAIAFIIIIYSTKSLNRTQAAEVP